MLQKFSLHKVLEDIICTFKTVVLWGRDVYHSTQIIFNHLSFQVTDILVNFLAESYASSNCTEHWLTVCQNQFNENNLKTCQEILELRSCLKACANNIWPSHARIRVQYESLMNKVNSFPDCLPPSKGMPFLTALVQLLIKCYMK